MKLNINRKLLPVKAHFFFFFAALGPILPQLNVFGKQLGASPAVMGVVTAFLPLFWAAAKPLFGYVVDFWPNRRKQTFIMLIIVMSGSYCCLGFIPMPLEETPETDTAILESIYKLDDNVILKKINLTNNITAVKYTCHSNCSVKDEFVIYLTNQTLLDTIYTNKEVSYDSCSEYKMLLIEFANGNAICSPLEDCNLICYDDMAENKTKRESNTSEAVRIDIDRKSFDLEDPMAKTVSKSLPVTKYIENESSLYVSAGFWAFVVLMCVGTVAFNVANCIGDAVCFDVLGPEKGTKYGAQRAWGTIGYGLAAFLGGWLIDVFSFGSVKNFTPAFILALLATAVDVECCRGLTLPPLTSPDDSGKALKEVLKIPRVVLFIIFAIVAGTFDSFIIYYMFWLLEDLAETTNYIGQIKFIEGVVTASQSLVGELLFFYFSGKIIKKWGYGNTMTFSLFCYGVRLFLISMIQNPWHLVFIEAIMQGPSYALCYSTIVGYAAFVAPEGYSATVQGIVAGMDDGVGFAIGSLLGGVMYTNLGGRSAFMTLAVTGVIAAALHAVLFALVTRKDKKQQPPNLEFESEKMLQTVPNNAIYHDTVEPVVQT